MKEIITIYQISQHIGCVKLDPWLDAKFNHLSSEMIGACKLAKFHFRRACVMFTRFEEAPCQENRYDAYAAIQLTYEALTREEGLV